MSSQFSVAYSPKISAASLLYLTAASSAVSKVPRYLRLPWNRISATHRLPFLVRTTPRNPDVLWDRILELALFSDGVARRRLLLRLFRPSRSLWSTISPLPAFVISLCIRIVRPRFPCTIGDLRAAYVVPLHVMACHRDADSHSASSASTMANMPFVRGMRTMLSSWCMATFLVMSGAGTVTRRWPLLWGS